MEKYWVHEDIYENSVQLICKITNISDQRIELISPKTFRVFPQPWKMKVNEKESSLYSSSLFCAPKYSNEEIIELEPGKSTKVNLFWNSSISNYSNEKGAYLFQVRYMLNSENTGVNTNKVQDIECEWSNAIEVKIN